MNVEAVNRAVNGSDAVVSALGHGKGAPDDLLACASANLITAMRADGVDRLVALVVSAVDDLEDRPGLFYRAAPRPPRASSCRAVVRDHRDQASLIDARAASTGRSSAARSSTPTGRTPATTTRGRSRASRDRRHLAR